MLLSNYLPPDFPDYGKIFQETGFDLFHQTVNLNKFIIELLDVATNNFGVSIILYTVIIKAFLLPLYYS